jgi:Protein of unknown function (DUF3237)
MDIAHATPSLELLYTSEFDLGVAVDAGLSPRGLRRAVPIVKGRFEGPRLSGTVLPGGIDWQLVRMDGVVEVDATYALETERGSKILVRNTGLLKAPATVLGLLAVGQVPDPASYYFRTRAVFETGDDDVAWLNRLVAIGVAEIRKDQVVVTIYQVK